MDITINKIYTILIAVSGVLMLTGCPEDTEEEDKRALEQRYFDLYVESSYPDVSPQPNGLYFIEHKEGTGSMPDTADWVLIDYVATMIPQDIIFESYLENVAIDNNFYKSGVLYGPFKMKTVLSVEGLTEGLLMMKEGGQSIMFFTSDLGYGPKGFGQVGGYQSLKYEVELLEVLGDIEAYEEARMQAVVDTLPNPDTIHDPAMEAIMYYTIDELTDGDSIKADSVVQMTYKGYLIDGRVFDEATADAPFEVVMGTTELIQGWDLGLLRFKEGEKGRLVIPWQLGYGSTGSLAPGTSLISIPPYETLIFDIEILSVGAPTDPDPEPDL